MLWSNLKWISPRSQTILQRNCNLVKHFTSEPFHYLLKHATSGIPSLGGLGVVGGLGEHLRLDGALLVENASGQCHKLAMCGVPVVMVYRDGKYMLKIPQTAQSCEWLVGIWFV